MTNEWTVGGIVILFIGYIIMTMVPVLLLAGIIAYILQKVKDVRTQVVILVALGIIAALFSLPVLFFPPGISSSYLLLSPVSLLWELAIVLPLIVLWHYSSERVSSMDAVICTISVSVIFLILAIVLLILAFATRTLLLDPLLFLQFVLPTPDPVTNGVYFSLPIWVLRFSIVPGLASLSYLLMRGFRTIRRKRIEESNA